MSRKTTPPPEIEYEYVEDGDTRTLEEAFNYLFDKYFEHIKSASKE
jgi:hypothetical protein